MEKYDINNFDNESRILLNYQTNIFHLLDGYLNENFGGSHIKNWDKIIKLNLNTSHELIFKNKILFDVNFIQNIKDVEENIVLMVNFERTRITFFNLAIRKIKENIIISPDNVIISYGTTTHAICILLVKKNDKIYLIIVNSGDGIQYHKNNKKSSIPRDKNSLWECYLLSDNDKLEESHYLTLAYILYIEKYLNFIGDCIIKIRKSIHRNIYSNREKLIEKFSTITYTDWNNIYPGINKQIFIDGLEYFTQRDKHKLLLYLIYNVMDKLERDHTITRVNNMDLFDKSTFETFNTKWSEKKKHIQHNYENIFFSRSFELYDNNLYTEPQKSGTCSWFSLYWSIFAHRLIKGDTIILAANTSSNNVSLFDYLNNMTIELYNDMKDIFHINHKLDYYPSRYRQEYGHLMFYLNNLDLYPREKDYLFHQNPNILLYYKSQNINFFIKELTYEDNSLDYKFIIDKFKYFEEEIKNVNEEELAIDIYNKICILFFSKIYKYYKEKRIYVMIHIILVNILGLLLKLDNKNIIKIFKWDQLTNGILNSLNINLILINLTKHQIQLLSKILLFLVPYKRTTINMHLKTIMYTSHLRNEDLQYIAKINTDNYKYTDQNIFMENINSTNFYFNTQYQSKIYEKDLKMFTFTDIDTTFKLNNLIIYKDHNYKNLSYFNPNNFNILRVNPINTINREIDIYIIESILYSHILDESKLDFICETLIKYIKKYDKMKINKGSKDYKLYKIIKKKIILLFLCHILRNYYIMLITESVIVIDKYIKIAIHIRNLQLCKNNKCDNIENVTLNNVSIINIQKIIKSHEYNFKNIKKNILDQVSNGITLGDTSIFVLEQFMKAYSVESKEIENPPQMKYKGNKCYVYNEIEYFNVENILSYVAHSDKIDSLCKFKFIADLYNVNRTDIYVNYFVNRDRNKILIYNWLGYLNKNEMNNNLLIDMTLENNISSGKLTIKHVKFNDYDVILDDIDKYPFINFLPSVSNFWLLQKENNYKIIMWDYKWDESNDFQGQLIFNEDSSLIHSTIVELNIKNNMILFDTNKETDNLLINLYIENGIPKYLYPLYENKINVVIDQTEKKYGLINYKTLKKVYMERYDINKFDDNHFRKLLKTKINLSDTYHLDYKLIDSELFNSSSNLINYEQWKKILYITQDDEPILPTSDFVKLGLLSPTIDNFKTKIAKCKLDCTILNKENEQIITAIGKKLLLIKDELFYLTKSLVWKDIHHIGVFIKNNSGVLFKIIQTNKMIIGLYRLKKILSKCLPLSCRDLIEINNILKFSFPQQQPTVAQSKYLISIDDYWDIPMKQEGGTDINMHFSDAFFQIISGYLVRKDQWTKYNEILDNFRKDGSTHYEVHQLMMGKGKSSVITPLLYLYLYSMGKDKINIILPSNLINQANVENFIFQDIFKIPINIVDVNHAKLNYLEIMGKEISNQVYIFDEFDSMYDPISSNFNYIIKNIEVINKVVFDLIFKLMINATHERWVYNIYQYTRIVEEINLIKDDIRNGSLYSNLHYGMDHGSQYKYIVPYIRKDEPLKNSKFSSILRTVALTIQYFIEKKDTYHLDKDNLKEIYDSRGLGIFPRSLRPNIQLKFREDFDIFNKHCYEIVNNDKNKIYLLYNYIYEYIIKTILISSEIYNLSFLELIGNHDKAWKIGYTGTVNLNLPKYPTDEKQLFKKIIEDKDETINVFTALTGTIESTDNNLYHLNKPYKKSEIDIILEKLNIKDYQCLIDIAAFLKDYSNYEVINKIKTLGKYENKIFVFLDDNNNKLIMENGNLRSYKNEIFDTDKVFYYYSQRNTVGIDFKQPTQIYGLVIINEHNNYTQVAQGIYRLRKLNVGHKFDIFYMGNIISLVTAYKKQNQIGDDNIDIYMKVALYYYLVNKDKNERENKQQLLSLLNLKYLVRRITPQKKNYIENDIKPYFQIENEINQELLIDRLEKNILNIDKFKRNEGCIQYIYDKISTFNIDDLKYMLLNISSSVEVAAEEQQQEEAEAQAQAQAQSQIIYSMDFKKKFNSLSFNISFVPTMTTEQIRECCLLVFDDFYITFTMFWYISHVFVDDKHALKNLTNSLFNLNDKLFIIKIAPNLYLIERTQMTSYYYDKYPIYTLEGEQLNTYISQHVKDINEFSKNIIILEEDDRLKLEKPITQSTTKYLKKDRFYKKYTKYKMKYILLKEKYNHFADKDASGSLDDKMKYLNLRRSSSKKYILLKQKGGDDTIKNNIYIHFLNNILLEDYSSIITQYNDNIAFRTFIIYLTFIEIIKSNNMNKIDIDFRSKKILDFPSNMIQYYDYVKKILNDMKDSNNMDNYNKYYKFHNINNERIYNNINISNIYRHSELMELDKQGKIEAINITLFDLEKLSPEIGVLTQEYQTLRKNKDRCVIQCKDLYDIARETWNKLQDLRKKNKNDESLNALTARNKLTRDKYIQCTEDKCKIHIDALKQFKKTHEKKIQLISARESYENDRDFDLKYFIMINK